MKSLLPVLVLFLAQTTCAADAAYPTGPDERLTPGSLCDKPDTKRYPERIPYCSRSVKSDEKNDIIREYDSTLGYRIGQMNRSAFKIDHYIPLCMGGSNRPDNLWPQHQSVYAVTDPLEQVACEKMAKGVLRQADAVDLIRRAKNDLSDAPRILQYVRGL